MKHPTHVIKSKSWEKFAIDRQVRLGIRLTAILSVGDRSKRWENMSTSKLI